MTAEATRSAKSPERREATISKSIAAATNTGCDAWSQDVVLVGKTCTHLDILFEKPDGPLMVLVSRPLGTIHDHFSGEVGTFQWLVGEVLDTVNV